MPVVAVRKSQPLVIAKKTLERVARRSAPKTEFFKYKAILP